ncbi:hypothetical protein D9611_004977 [Ephemerocybe angulata]|uniref:CCHC-type domain-containing protein n=1 Tax=Ephemerocybe angulata TaxID=980116 RepID=A0A8H5B416_9AGAR|nr:hypothetical protein D9611_004977 [Tulosesus angulatus]
MADEQARIRALDPDATGEGFPGLPMSNKNFPNSYSANRPKYDSTKPEEFLEYVRQVEDVISACEIIADRLKKKALVHFRDMSEQSLWTTLPEYKTGTYAEFKEKLFLYHPTAALQNRGSLARIQLLCARHQGIGLDASHTLLQFALKFRAEAAKLEKHLMSNNELVNLFLGALDEPFRTKAWEVLSKEAETDDTLEVVAGEKIIPFDRWISCAEKLAVQRERFGERFGGKKGGILAKPSVVSAPPSTPAVTPAAPSKLYEPGWNDEPTVKVEYEDLEHRVLQGVSSLLDQKLSAIDKKMISRDAYMETQLEELRAGQGRADKFMRQPNNFAVATQQNNPGSRGGFGFGNNTRGPPPSAGSICYYCNGQGHFANDCQAKQKHISEGKIVSGPDGTFDKHGNRLRNMPGTSLKEIVDKLPMPTASQNVQHYYDDSADYVRDQFHQAPYQESEMITRDEMNILRDEIYHLSSLREQGSSARAKNMQPQAQFVQKPVVEPWKELQQEQRRSNQLMSQLVAALTPMIKSSQLRRRPSSSQPLLAGTIAPTRSPSPATSDGSEPDSCAPYLHGLQIDSAYLRSTTDPVWSSVYWYIDRNGSTVYTDCAEQPCPHAKETEDSIPGFYLSGLRGELVLPLVPQYLHPTSPPSRVPPPSSPPPPYSPKLPDYPSPPPTMSDNARLEALFTRLIEAQTKTNEQLTKLATAQTQAASAVAPPAPAPTSTTTQVGAVNVSTGSILHHVGPIEGSSPQQAQHYHRLP